MADEVTTAISTNAQGPQSVTQDGTTVQQHNLKDQIEADRYLKGQTAAGRKAKGLRFMRISPPGTV